MFRAEAAGACLAPRLWVHSVRFTCAQAVAAGERGRGRVSGVLVAEVLADLREAAEPSKQDVRPVRP